MKTITCENFFFTQLTKAVTYSKLMQKCWPRFYPWFPEIKAQKCEQKCEPYMTTAMLISVNAEEQWLVLS